MSEDTPVKLESIPQSPDLGEQLKKLKVATDSLDRGKAYEDDLSELKASVSELPSETRVEMVRKFISGELTDKSNGLDKYALGQVFRVLVDTDKEAVVNLFIDELKDVKGYSYEKFFNLGIIANSGLDMQMVFEGLTESEADSVQKAIDRYKRPDDEAIESSVCLLYGLERGMYATTDRALKDVVSSDEDIYRLSQFVKRSMGDVESDKFREINTVCETMFYLVGAGKLKADREYYDYFKKHEFDIGGEKKIKSLLLPILDADYNDSWRELLSIYRMDEYDLANMILIAGYEPLAGSAAERMFHENISSFQHYPTVLRLMTVLVSNYGGELSRAPENLSKPLLDRIKDFTADPQLRGDASISVEMSSLLIQLALSGQDVYPELFGCFESYSAELQDEHSYAINSDYDYFSVRLDGPPINCTDLFVRRYAKKEIVFPGKIAEVFGERLLDEKKLAKTLLNRHLYDLGEVVGPDDSDEIAINKILESNSYFNQECGEFIDEQLAKYDINDLKQIFKGNRKGNKVCIVGLRHLSPHQRSIYVDMDSLFPDKSKNSIRGLITNSRSIDDWVDCEHFLVTFSDNESLSNFSESERYLVNSIKEDPDNLDIYLKHKDLICGWDVSVAKEKVELLKTILSSKVPGVVAVQDSLIVAVLGSQNGAAEFGKISEILSDRSTPELVSTIQIFKLLYTLNDLAPKYDHRRGTGSRVIARHANTYRDLVQEGKPEQAERVQGVFDALIYSDLLKIAVRTADPSLSDFGVAIAGLKSRVAEGAEVETDQLALLVNLHNIVDGDNISINSLSVEQAAQELLKRSRTSSLAELVGSYEKKLLTHLGIEKVEDLAGLMDSERFNSDRRNRELVASGKLTLGEGSLIKGVHTLYLDSYSSHGFRCPELLGANSAFDGTPNDVDVSLVLPEDATGSMRDTVEASLAKGYGDFMIVIANKDVSESPDGKVDPGKYELVRQNVDRHVGIRSGFGWYDIEAVIIKNEENLEKIKYYIAEKGAYIPIVDRDGTVVFSEEEFDELIQKRNSLSEVNVRGLLAIKEPIAASEMIDVLRQSDYLDNLYGSHLTPASTLADHSLNVARIYEEVDVGDEQRLLEPNAMKLALLLHDIGKTQAVEVENDSNKQHLYTEKIVRRFFKDSGVDLKTASIVTSLVSQDFLGHYFQDMEDLEQTVFLVKSEAKKLGVEPADYLELIRVYFMYDAGSYTSKHGDTNLLDGVFDTSIEGKLDLSEDYKSKLDLLRRGL